MASQPAALVLEGGTLIDGSGGPPLRNASIVIEGNRIQAVGPKGTVSYPAGATVVDATGQHILPGFIDMHVHYRDWMPQLLTSHGITSVVDLANDPDWIVAQKDGIAKGKIDGPRLWIAGQGLGGPPNLTGVIEPFHGPQEAGKKARQNLDLGADLLKVYTHITPEELEVVVSEARGAGKPVMGHLNSLDAVQAARGGISAVAHATGVASAAILDNDKLAQFRLDNEIGLSVDFPQYLMAHADVDRGLLEGVMGELPERNVCVEFNFVNIAKGVTPRCDQYESFDVRLLNRPDLQYLPEDFKLRALSYNLWQDLSEEELSRLRLGLDIMQEFARKFAAAGGRVLVGTDIQAYVIPGSAITES